MSRVIDTNILVYLTKDLLLDPLPDRGSCVSVVTELELLSLPFAGSEDEARVREMLRATTIVPLTEDVKSHAVAVRRGHRLKLPDAIVAGTALALDAELWTNDDALVRLPGLRCRRPLLKGS